MGADSPFAKVAPLPDYSFRIEFWAILGCVLLFVALIELVRRHRLKERYSFLWFMTSGVLLVFALRRDWLEDLAKFVGVYYPPTALFLLLVFFMLLILVHFSTVISGLLGDKQALSQSVGLLEARVRELENSLGRDSGASPAERTSSNAD